MEAQIDLVKESILAIKPHIDKISCYYFDTLFKMSPSLAEKLQALDLSTDKQKEIMFSTLCHIVDYWEEREHLIELLTKSGVNLGKLGIEEEHFQYYWKALTLTLSYYLESYWTNDLENQWQRVFYFIKTYLGDGLKKLHHIPDMNTARSNQIPVELEDLVRSFARELLKRVVLEEAKNSCTAIARECAKEILKEAMESEIKHILERFEDKTA